MRFKRIDDAALGDIIKVGELLRAVEAGAELPEPFAGVVEAGTIAPNGADAICARVDGAIVASAGIGDYVAVFDGKVSLLSERALLRGYDPA